MWDCEGSCEFWVAGLRLAWVAVVSTRHPGLVKAWIYGPIAPVKNVVSCGESSCSGAVVVTMILAAGLDSQGVDASCEPT